MRIYDILDKLHNTASYNGQKKKLYVVLVNTKWTILSLDFFL